MTQALPPSATRVNRWLAAVSGMFFVGNRVRNADYWGAVFGAIVFVWVACRYPFSDRPWAAAARRTAEVAFVTTVLAAIWFTIRS